MNKMIVIALREYRAMVRTKAFVITMVLMPVLMCGAIFVQSLLRGRVDIDDRQIVVLDHTGLLYGELELAGRERNENAIFDSETGRQIKAKYVLVEESAVSANDELRLALSERVRQNEVFAFLEIEQTILEKSEDEAMSAARLYSESVAASSVRRWFQSALGRIAQTKRLENSGLNAELVAWAVAPVRIESMGLYETTDSGEVKQAEKTNRELALLVPMGVLMLMWVSIMLAAQPMLQSVIEEKQQRIAEVLLGSASPFDIMMGKLLGNVGVSLTIVSVYAVGGYMLADYYGHAQAVPVHIIGWFLVYEVLAVLLFGSVFIAVGAACSELREAQSFLMPIFMVLILPLMVWPHVLKDPMSSFSTYVSLFPPATPMLMVLRLAVSQAIPVWQPLLGVVLVLASVLVAVFLAGRIFRIGILSQGKTPRVGELIRWVIRG